MSSSIIFDGFKFQVAQVCRKMCNDCQYSEDSSSCFVNRKTTDHWQYDLCLLYCQCKCRDSTDYRDLTPIPPAPMGLPLPITPMVSDYTRQHLDLGSVSGSILSIQIPGKGYFVFTYSKVWTDRCIEIKTIKKKHQIFRKLC